MCDYSGTMTTGLDLKLARTRERVKAKHVAEAMGVSPSRITKIEAEAVVSPGIASRYLDAVEQVRTSGTSAVA
jgi:transcriptional regulator with XRE-family HTH domain